VARLHETLERQAVTDERTRLANVRAFTSILDRDLDPLRQSLIAAADAALYPCQVRREGPRGPGSHAHA